MAIRISVEKHAWAPATVITADSGMDWRILHSLPEYDSLTVAAIGGQNLPKGKRLRAIDLYSGVGGWSLGLAMAGIDVVASYDRWERANMTNNLNNRHPTHTADIRTLSLPTLPHDIDIVVGSPPCVAFSYSNRGGKGDIDDGLQDVEKFLTVVQYLKPRAWAMENVPRMAAILSEELAPKGRLARFQKLHIQCEVIDLRDFGLPQRRRRCVAGNFDFRLLASYAGPTTDLTLGTVINALGGATVRDPLYAFQLPRGQLRDHEKEVFLNEEETRINRANKTLHPVYNTMPFPDPLTRSARTVTATCTRVSRESIIVEEESHPGSFRRLSLRERASLQGFPLTFQFYGNTYAQKLRMVGNALPPLFSYHVGCAIRQITAQKLKPFPKAATKFRQPHILPNETSPDIPGATYRWNRSFRFAIPRLRLKSGVRFELINRFDETAVEWNVSFVFGTSKSIHNLRLDFRIQERILSAMGGATDHVIGQLHALRAEIRAADIVHMQDVWSHHGPGGTRPFMLLDRIDDAVGPLVDIIRNSSCGSSRIIAAILKSEFGRASSKLAGTKKLAKYADIIVAGMLIGATVNIELHQHGKQVSPRLRKSHRTYANHAKARMAQ